MKPIINLEEAPGKTVGRVERRNPFEAHARLVREFHAMGLKLPFPKGVYRFKTHAEANEWEWNHIMEAAKKKYRAHRMPQT